jgi:hypothetical protein
VLSDTQQGLLKAAVDEFYEVMIALEALVDGQTVYAWNEH